ncbi:NAD(P)/FAD-dependent oxidoreductase [Rhizobium sp. SSA_523]|uniref:NAD(P)/FAD-dependent oxidoreductase n=1 Tax=Rhizobium sp. SSA_523 TaxID=2952477 RepID=UPI00209150A9|nr:FAD-dependent oxidoreductase [Rhizobium sp. SSA_523]MCO5732819.1 FAD-dependent oxidoreductase [Rhizobium sp. SSA_523]WKC23563.1 FAD-dependent oxidoreductase [Rhizobium sp. SSA_523]
MVPNHSSRRRIAVIGSGISGLSAAWLTAKTHDVVLYESEARLGGHSNTDVVATAYGNVPVDTGFIVFNDKNYPNLVALFEHLGVRTQASDMSFSASIDDGAFEYSGTGLKGLLGQRSNAARPRFWRMLSDVLRFYRSAEDLLKRGDLEGVTLGEFLDRERYSPAFIDDHLLPMGAAIWSMTTADMRSYPLHAFLRFFVHHGLILLSGRPQWRTVSGGSREYVAKLAGAFPGEIRLGCKVERIVRNGSQGVTVIDSQGERDQFDEVVLATHADQALRLLAESADPRERDVLGRFRYTENIAVLHEDRRLMPKRTSVWSSWNYIAGRRQDRAAPLCVTYWMNRLQNLDPRHPLFVTLNPCRDIADGTIHATYRYTHPLYDLPAMAAQRQLWELQGRRHVWFCGAHFGSGFHEDGLQAGLAVAEAISGLNRPWQVAEPSGRIYTSPLLTAAE